MLRFLLQQPNATKMVDMLKDPHARALGHARASIIRISTVAAALLARLLLFAALFSMSNRGPENQPVKGMQAYFPTRARPLVPRETAEYARGISKKNNTARIARSSSCSLRNAVMEIADGTDLRQHGAPEGYVAWFCKAEKELRADQRPRWRRKQAYRVQVFQWRTPEEISRLMDGACAGLSSRNAAMYDERYVFSPGESSRAIIVGDVRPLKLFYQDRGGESVYVAGDGNGVGDACALAEMLAQREGPIKAIKVLFESVDGMKFMCNALSHLPHLLTEVAYVEIKCDNLGEADERAEDVQKCAEGVRVAAGLSDELETLIVGPHEYSPEHGRSKVEACPCEVPIMAPQGLTSGPEREACSNGLWCDTSPEEDGQGLMESGRELLTKRGSSNVRGRDELPPGRLEVPHADVARRVEGPSLPLKERPSAEDCVPSGSIRQSSAAVEDSSFSPARLSPPGLSPRPQARSSGESAAGISPRVPASLARRMEQNEKRQNEEAASRERKPTEPPVVVEREPAERQRRYDHGSAAGARARPEPPDAEVSPTSDRVIPTAPPLARGRMMMPIVNDSPTRSPRLTGVPRKEEVECEIPDMDYDYWVCCHCKYDKNDDGTLFCERCRRRNRYKMEPVMLRVGCTCDQCGHQNRPMVDKCEKCGEYLQTKTIEDCSQITKCSQCRDPLPTLESEV